MNNSQFRKLLVDTPARNTSDGESNNGAAATPRSGNAPAALGSKQRSSIPMTPRSIGLGHNSGRDFARQLAERNAGSDEQTTAQRKFKTQKVRGTKLADGYTDRTAGRRVGEGGDEGGEDDRATRVKALEDLVKLQQIDQATFEKLRDEIVGGDVRAVGGLVKGLDYKLLERARRGEVGVEDVLEEKPKPKVEDDDEAEASNGEDIEDAFDQLEEKDITANEREERSKRGEMAKPGLVPGQKRTRDMILAEMKAARLAAKEAAAPSLGSKFRKVGAPRVESRIERDGKGREVLITIDEHGREKRKVRKIQVEPEPERGHGLEMPDKDIAPLGMVVPSLPEPKQDEEDDIDIFDDVGDDYDPLAGLSGSDSEDDATSEKESSEVQESKPVLSPSSGDSERKDSLAMPPPPKPAPKPAAPRNYFNEKPSVSSDSAVSAGSKAMADPTILAALKKASTLNAASANQSAEEKAREEKRKRMLQQDDRDAEDMDMGFGGSRFEDQADLDDDGSTKLSAWGADGDGDDGAGKGGRKERKRGPKKRKGDKNSAADVLGVMERRKGEGS